MAGILKSRDSLVKRAQKVLALGLMQLVALTGVVGLAVILGAVLMSSAKAEGRLARCACDQRR
jgi:hypothetical protein